MKRVLIALSVLLLAAVAAPAAAERGEKGKHKGGGPEVIQLPVGFGPEGITTTKRHTVLVGSRESGAIYKGSLRSGEGDVLVDPDPVFRATGMKVDKRGRLFVSGANSKLIRVFDVRSGDLIESFDVPDGGFINDVILTKRAAYFTDSQFPVLYKLPIGRDGELGAPVPLPLTGEWEQVAGQFNANGIEKAKGGRTLIVVNSFTGKLFTVDATTGFAREIDLGGDYTTGAGFNANGIEAVRGGKRLLVVKSNTGELFDVDAATGVADRIDVSGGELVNADGILRKGRKLYVVQNQLNLVTPVKLSRDLAEGDKRDSITSPLFNVPTTIARSGGRNYVVNAKFGSNSPTQTYEVVRVPKK